MFPRSRTRSSSNLRDQPPAKRYHESQQEIHSYNSDDEDFYIIGDRVYVDGFRAASVAYFGEVGFAQGDWVGVVLDEPTGNHNGKFHGREYFQCAPSHGLFVRPSRVSHMRTSGLGRSLTPNRSSMPRPGSHGHRSVSRSPGSSTMDSYFYDEDYRQDGALASTERLKSIREHSPRCDFRGIDQYPVVRTKGCILEREPRSNSVESPIGARIQSLLQQTRNESPTNGSSVFSFRPQRERLVEVTQEGHPYRDNTRVRVPPRVDLSSEPIRLGDRVVVYSEKGDLKGTLRYMGETDFATGEWAGIELEGPDGKNDGTVLGRSYFLCPRNHGLFVPAAKVRKYEEESLNYNPFNSIRSTITSPPPSSFVKGTKHLEPNHDEKPRSSAYRSTIKRVYSPGSNFTSPIDSQSTSRQRLFSDTPKPPLRSNSSLINQGSSYNLNDTATDHMFHSWRSRSEWMDTKMRDYPREQSFSRPHAATIIKYTFSTSEHDGDPITRRTVEYA